MEASITLKKVGKLVGDKTILASLTFGVERGSLVAIIGDNEAGKSMLLKVIAGVEYQESVRFLLMDWIHRNVVWKYYRQLVLYRMKLTLILG